jgi:hypothetical protein
MTMVQVNISAANTAEFHKMLAELSEFGLANVSTVALLTELRQRMATRGLVVECGPGDADRQAN